MRVTRPLIALALTPVLLLTGCGVASTSFQPGVAAEVGERTLTTSYVDGLVTDYCAAIEDQLAEGGQVVPLSYLRQGIIGQLSLVAAVEQLADDYDVEPSEEYAAQVAELEASLEQLPEDAREARLAVDPTPVLVTDLLRGIGEEVLAAEGGAGASPEEQDAAGQAALTGWIEDNEVDLDPRYSFSIADGVGAPVDTSLSVAVSDEAKNGLAENPDPAYSESLPSNQACG